ncbi:hypothetical protein D3C74_479860 [compost metagenome]
MLGPEHHAARMPGNGLLGDIQQGEADQLHLADRQLCRPLLKVVDLQQHHHEPLGVQIDA